MDMNREVKENLDLQMKYFPNIYNSYLNKEKDEVAVTEEEEFIEYTKESCIHIISDSIEEILLSIFKISKCMLIDIDFENIEEVHLIKHFSTNIDEYGKILEVKYPYPYILKVNKVIIGKKINKKIYSNIMKIFLLKKLNLFERNYIKELNYKVEYIESLEVLEETLTKFKPKYNFKNLIEIKESNPYTNEYGIREEYKDIIILDLIKIVVDSEKKDKVYIVKNIINYINKKFEEESLNILKYYMTDDFLNNYKIIDNYIKTKNKWIKLINKKYISNLEEYIEKIILNKKSEQITQLLNGKLKELDHKYMDLLNNLIKKLNRVGEI